MSLFSVRSSRVTSRILVPTVFVVLLLITYLLDWWAIHIETHDKDGKTRYRVVAQINWYTKQLQKESDGSFVKKYNKSIPENHVLPNKDDHSVLFNHRTTKPSNAYIIKNREKSSSLNSLVSINIPDVHVSHVNCKSLARGVFSEIQKANRYQKSHHKKITPDKDYINLASDCSTFIKTRHYAIEPLSPEEADFPIAYSLLIFKDIEQVERLLRAIYRPQNYYCVHIDAKVSAVIREAMKAITRCFDNVFLSSRSVRVKWGAYTVLEPDLICMENLWKYKWKYFINLTGQEFPLQTNWDIVKILKAFNGSNNAEGTVKRRNVGRTQYVHDGIFTDYKQKKGPSPIHARLTKGSVHIIVQRGFVDYVLHDPDAHAFREWVKDTGVPDETFFSSLIYSPNLNIPGAYKGEPETDKIDDIYKPAKNPFLARFKNWGTWPFNWDCKGQRVRMVCIFGVGDLEMLVNRRELFANKFYIDYHPLAYDCLEEFHFNKTRDEVLGRRTFDTSFYRNLDIVKNHVS